MSVGKKTGASCLPRFRHTVIQTLRKAKCEQGHLDNSANARPTQNDPKLLKVVAKVAASHRLHSCSNAIKDVASCSIEFALATYEVLENAGEITIDVLLHRRKLSSDERISSPNRLQSSGNSNLSTGVITVEFETREGTAKKSKDFVYTAGILLFTDKDYHQRITIPIIDDHQYNPDTEFYVILKNPCGDASLGDPSVTRITIFDDDNPGDFVFEKSQLYAEMTSGEVHATVLRQNGSDGDVEVSYATMDGTGIGGEEGDNDVDYTHTSGVLHFKHQETSKVVSVQINKNVTVVKNFVIILRNPSYGSHLGEHSAAVANLNLQPGELNTLSRVIMEENDTSWAGQFASAMKVDGEIDEFGIPVTPSRLEYFAHFITMPWKLIFALTPPAQLWGGYPAFVVSMLLIGTVTAIIEKLGNLLGCVSGLSSKTTGILIIAMGTSLPDTIASRTAALQDSTADAAIGNITGSNSVNVFLGVGLPWLIRSIYSATIGELFYVNTDGLSSSVTLFGSLGAVCIVCLILRRFLLGGELGGKSVAKWATGTFLFSLWVVFIISSIAL